MRRTRRKSYGDASARWPESVFGVGDEPDPRFTFANQRTLLAWIRTALACILGAAVIDALAVEVTPTVRAAGIVVLSALGAMSAIHGWRSWRRSELALRRSEPLREVLGRASCLPRASWWRRVSCWCWRARVWRSAVGREVVPPEGLQERPGLHEERTALSWDRTRLSAVLGAAVMLRLAMSHRGAAGITFAVACGTVIVALVAAGRGGPERRAFTLVVVLCVVAAFQGVNAVLPSG